MKRFFTIIASMLFVFAGSMYTNAQQPSVPDKYKLLTEPFNIRPINVHKGQFQFNTGYQLSIRTKYYDSDREVIGLSENGTASIEHSYLLSLRYGVLEFLELGAEMNYSKKGVRQPSETFLSGTSYVNVNRLNEYMGFEDLFLHASLSLPFDIDNVDFALKSGISLSTANHEPDKPEHIYTDFLNNSYNFDYHYINHNGTGTPVWKAGADLQLAFNKITLYTTALFSSPLNEVDSYYWSEFFENGDFIYTSHDYSFLPQESLNIYASFHYQAIDWLDLSLAINHFRSTGGWVSNNDIKYSIPDLALENMELGMEIQVSPLIRLSEIIGFTVGGRNTEAPIYILTSLSFNMMPF